MAAVEDGDVNSACRFVYTSLFGWVFEYSRRLAFRLLGIYLHLRVVCRFELASGIAVYKQNGQRTKETLFKYSKVKIGGGRGQGQTAELFDSCVTVETRRTTAASGELFGCKQLPLQLHGGHDAFEVSGTVGVRIIGEAGNSEHDVVLLYKVAHSVPAFWRR